MQDLDESLPELDVEGGVYDGVDGAVDVTEPGESGVEFCRDVTVRVHDVRDEERQPAYNKNTYVKNKRIIIEFFIILSCPMS